ncbi:unnamed protein product (macronuclear) [Paramecium tetraurelia]|uniref:RBR-type E3 ubiquitin transferase n=1 Tax=Paramecium tetraurelia TaxID=5888 RepID=A0BG82_PARTE|nr:uncharacterized protein GSPATT00028584001 [Paramecium tetraurelia]CAK57549.1 unnamed protein product [Paramecium tetraurelia]|eukprot:XP_001424947.1 hypothetical protein (macronuclear) [Paramecium tetraurelia strain d4-2]
MQERNCPCCCCTQNENEFVTSKDCQCIYCYSCLVEQIKVKREEKCLACQQDLDFLKIFHDTKYEPQIQEILCIKYLQNSLDVLPCPKADCKYYGIIPDDCDGNYECEKCHTIWREQNITFFNKQKLFTRVMQFFLTKQCPQCNVLIQKNGGCPQMKCQHCRFQFCWDCNQDTVKHIQFNCMLIKSFHIMIFLSWGLQLLYTMGFFDIFTQIFGFIVHYLLICITCPLLIILPVYSIYLAFYKKKFKEFAMVFVAILPTLHFKDFLELDWDTILSVSVFEIAVMVLVIIKKYNK